MKKITILLLVIFILCGCGKEEGTMPQANGETVTGSGQESEAESVQDAKEGQELITGNVQETAETTQENLNKEGQASGCMILEDGHSIYLCSPYMVTKVDKGTGDAVSLWESDKKRLRSAEYTYSGGRGVLIGDIIYFIEEWMDESSENYGATKKALSRIHTDGTGYGRLEEKYITDIFVQEGILYLRISENEVYLMGYSLAEDGSLIMEEATKDTKEDRSIPDTYTTASYFSAEGRKTLTPKESLDEFGYYLMRNDTYEFVRIFPETGEEELLPEELAESYLVSFNDEYLLMERYEEQRNVYYLVDRQTMEKQSLMDVQLNDEFIAMDEEHAYLRRSIETAGKITEYSYEKVNLKTAEATQLFSQESFIGLQTDVSSFMADTVLQNGYIYYVGMKDYKLYMMRRSIADPATEEILGEAFYDSRISEVGTVAYEHAEFFDDGTEQSVAGELRKEGEAHGKSSEKAADEDGEDSGGDLKESEADPCVTVDLEWLVVDERYPGASAINSYMKETMNESIMYEKGFTEEVASYRREYDEDFPAYGLNSSIHEITYVSDDYLSYCQAGYEYCGGAHGMPYRTGYTFNLQTGELLGLSDVIGNSEEELKEIVGGYFEELISKNPENYWEGSVENVKEWTDFDTDYYLTEEGIRFYQTPYAISSYAAGFPEVTIPYSEFEMKIPVGEDLKWASTPISEAELTAFAIQMTAEERDAFEAYYPILQEGKDFVLSADREYEEKQTVESVAVVDFDSDGVKEVILMFEPFGDYLILHKEGEDYYGLMLVFRGFLMPKQDGTHISSGGAACNVYQRLYFEGNKFHEEVLAEQVDYENFYIGGEKVSQQEFDDFIEGLNMDGKEDIVFYHLED